MRNVNTIAIMMAVVVLSSMLHLSAVAQQFVQQGPKLFGSGAIGPAYQGLGVALSSNGNTALVGGHRDNSFAGGAWVFTRVGSSWSQQGTKLVGTGGDALSSQGFSAALSADGNTAIIGGHGDNSALGAAWVFVRIGNVWTQQGPKLVGTGAIGVRAWQGVSTALSADGNTAIVGGAQDNTFVGAAWVFTRTGAVWTQQQKIVATGNVGAARFGYSVALSADGNTALVGGYADSVGTGASWVFTRIGSTWTQQGSKLVGTGAVGNAQQGYVDLSSDGNTAIIGGPNDNSARGAVWIFTRIANAWFQQGTKLVGTGAVGAASQGSSVSLSSDGNTALVGAPNDNLSRGAVWAFTRVGNTWSQQGTKAVGTGSVGAPVNQGISVALSADANTALVGGHFDNASAGATWVFVRSNTYSYNFSKNNLNKSILDNQNIFDTLTVFTTSPLTGLVQDVNVQIDTIIHPNVSDLEISLLHLGVNDTIAYQVGGSGDNFIGTLLDDSAATPIANGTAPFTGQFRPTRPLAQFNTLDVGGSWILRIFDRATGNTGTLQAWGLSIGVSGGPTSVGPVSLDVPAGFRLMQNYPNPFNPTTLISFQLTANSFVSLKVYDIIGREVATLVNEAKPAGEYTVEFDATGLSSGVYFYRLNAGGFTQTQRMILMK